MHTKVDGRGGARKNAGRPAVNTIAIQPRVMPETDAYLQSQISTTANTKGQVIDRMAEFCKANGFTAD